MRFLSIGECMIEMAPQADGLFSMGFAGDTFNTAWYLRRVASPSVEVAYMMAVGDDEPSDRMAGFMREAGITPQLVVRPGGTVGLYMISLKDGERSFAYWRSAAAARTLGDDLEGLPVQKGDVAFFSGITLAILPEAGRARLFEVLRQVRASGVTVAFDPNLRPRLWQDDATMCAAIMQAAEVCDIVLPSFEDEASYFGDADPAGTAARYRAAGAMLVVVKNGADEMLLDRDGARETLAPMPVEQVVDTTAAGDSFNAGFFGAYLDGATPVQAAAAGAALARKVICARGALVEVAV